MEVQLYQPHQNQARVHHSINNEPYKYYILNIGRQWGKSLMAMNQLYYWCFNEQVVCAWVSPIYKQAKKVFDEMVKAFDGTGLIKANASELIIKTKNGSTIQFFSSERYDNIRGFTFDYLVCDEFAFMDEKAWTEVLRATVLVKGKKVLLISTPKGKNHFYRMFNLEQVNPAYKSFKMTSYDGLAQHTEIDGAKETLPQHVFEQEYLAEFVDGGASIFKDIKINNEPQLVAPYYAGVDLGRADDYTVITVYNGGGQMVWCERWRQDTWANISLRVASVINKYECLTYIESNSIGDAIYEQVRNLSNQPQRVLPFVTSAKSKQDIIEQLSVGIQTKECTFLDVDWLLREMEVFTFEYNPQSRTVKYSAPSGFHDDGVMSAAIGYECLKKGKRVGQYYTTA